MKPTSLTIQDIFTANKNLTFLVGAGCSIDPPSCLPAGRSMMEAMLKFACAESELETILNIKELRFEALVEILRDFVDPKFRIIDFYGLFDKPDLQHFFLAENNPLNESVKIVINKHNRKGVIVFNW